MQQADCVKVILAVKAYEERLAQAIASKASLRHSQKIQDNTVYQKERERLEKLYEEARYSNHCIQEIKKKQALACIHNMRAALKQEKNIFLYIKCLLMGL